HPRPSDHDAVRRDPGGHLHFPGDRAGGVDRAGSQTAGLGDQGRQVSANRARQGPCLWRDHRPDEDRYRREDRSHRRSTSGRSARGGPDPRGRGGDADGRDRRDAGPDGARAPDDAGRADGSGRGCRGLGDPLGPPEGRLMTILKALAINVLMLALTVGVLYWRAEWGTDTESAQAVAFLSRAGSALPVSATPGAVPPRPVTVPLALHSARRRDVMDVPDRR